MTSGLKAKFKLHKKENLKSLARSIPGAEKQLKVLVQQKLRRGDTRDLNTRISSLLLEVSFHGTTKLLVDGLELLDWTGP